VQVLEYLDYLFEKPEYVLIELLRVAVEEPLLPFRRPITFSLAAIFGILLILLGGHDLFPHGYYVFLDLSDILKERQLGSERVGLAVVLVNEGLFALA